MAKDRVGLRQIIGAGLIFIGACRLWAMDPETTARRAWDEFGFQSFDNAQRLFMELEQAAAATPAQRREALIGLAMVAQFDERRPNLARAEALYRRALADESLTGQPRLLAEAMLAETLAMAGRLAEADALWDTLIRRRPASLIAQDALIRRTVAHLTTFAAPETAAAMAYCTARAAEMPAATPDNPGMAMPRERLLAWLHLGRKEYAAARAALMRLTDLAQREPSARGGWPAP
jgi:tetratricopeptide (TPR) repeat protein